MAVLMELELNLRRFTVDEYMQMARDGILSPDERTELIDGRIVVKMSQDPPHVGGIALGTDTFMRTMGDTHWIVPQCTVRLTNWSAPEPDFVAVSRTRWRPGQPLTGGDLFVEVSSSSLSMDRRHKTSLYAQAGVNEYWVVNLVDRCVEVYRDPVLADGTLYGGEYRTHTIHHSGEGVSPLCRSEVSIAVADLLPDPYAAEQP